MGPSGIIGAGFFADWMPPTKANKEYQSTHRNMIVNIHTMTKLFVGKPSVETKIKQ